MRTTVRLNEQLMSETKRFAARTGRTLTSLIEEGLRGVLRQKQKIKRKGSVRLKTFGGNGLQKKVDLDNTSGLLDWMEKHR